MQFCSACTYPAFGGHSRLFSRQEEKATVDLLSSRLDGSLLRPRFTFLFLARQIGAFPFPLRLSYDQVLCGLYVAMYHSTFLSYTFLFELQMGSNRHFRIIRRIGNTEKCFRSSVENSIKERLVILRYLMFFLKLVICLIYRNIRFSGRL